jgi:hypothetical protein|tara:strand:- start:1698 stop:2078 length:381 start_codon:yes stop_codon:yes gene_type:complete
MKGSTLEQCVEKAEKYISQNGVCVLVYDVKNSSSKDDLQSIYITLDKINEDLNVRFAKFIPNEPFGYDCQGHGFQSYMGDSAFSAVNSTSGIKEIIEYTHQSYPDIEFHWEIAKDYWDKKAIRMLK